MMAAGRFQTLTGQWQERLGNPDLVDVDELGETQSQIRCDDLGCTYKRGKQLFAMPAVASAVFEDCEHANVVIMPVIVRNCAAAKVLDDPQFWAHGAQALYIKGDEIRAQHTRPFRGVRPWSPGWKGNMEREKEPEVN